MNHSTTAANQCPPANRKQPMAAIMVPVPSSAQTFRVPDEAPAQDSSLEQSSATALKQGSDGSGRSGLYAPNKRQSRFGGLSLRGPRQALSVQQVRARTVPHPGQTTAAGLGPVSPAGRPLWPANIRPVPATRRSLSGTLVPPLDRLRDARVGSRPYSAIC